MSFKNWEEVLEAYCALMDFLFVLRNDCLACRINAAAAASWPRDNGMYIIAIKKCADNKISFKDDGAGKRERHDFFNMHENVI